MLYYLTKHFSNNWKSYVIIKFALFQSVSVLFPKPCNSIAHIQGIHRHPFGTASVRTAPLIKKDEVYMPGPAHYQRNPQSEEPGHEGEEAIPSARVQGSKNSFMFSSTSKRLRSPPNIVKVSKPK